MAHAPGMCAICNGIVMLFLPKMCYNADLSEVTLHALAEIVFWRKSSMEDLQTEQAEGTRVRRASRKPAVIACVVLGILLAAYLAVCGIAAASTVFYPNAAINGVAVGGMSVEEAAAALEKSLPDTAVEVYLSGENSAPAASVTYEQLGLSGALDYTDLARRGMSSLCGEGFLSRGWFYLRSLCGFSHGVIPLNADDSALLTAAGGLQKMLAVERKDSSFELDQAGGQIHLVKAQDGRSVDPDEVKAALKSALASPGEAVSVSAKTESAAVLTAQQLHDQVAAEVKNAGYDAATGTITPEQTGAEFDAAAAQKLLDAAAPGETVTLPADIELPSVTAETLRAVLFRDVLGTARTHVGGTAARISNVRLAASSVNGTVLNSGDVFSYNTTVGQRTTAKGYQPAPAYVQGETVDEIGGGVCQPSSTLYLACLNSNLEIVERSAHRYAPTYIEWGMDATVSWGGPDYKFKNDTEYPIKIVATYSGGYLTMKLLGTKTDGLHVKMTKEVLSTVDWKTVTQEDNPLPAGTEEVKVTPYTGHKVNSYRNLYDENGSLVSSKLEAVSNYKVRDKVVLVGTKPSAAVPASGTDPGTGTADPGTGTADPGTGTADPGAGTADPGTGTADPGTGTADPGTGTADPGTGAGTDSGDGYGA